MTIAENLFLGRERLRKGWLGRRLRVLDKPRMLQESVERLQELKVGIQSMSQLVETLSGGQRQCVAVARAAAFARHVVIMDEPTAALGVKEGNMVLVSIRRVDARARSVGGVDLAQHAARLRNCRSHPRRPSGAARRGA